MMSSTGKFYLASCLFLPLLACCAFLLFLRRPPPVAALTPPSAEVLEVIEEAWALGPRNPEARQRLEARLEVETNRSDRNRLRFLLGHFAREGGLFSRAEPLFALAERNAPLLADDARFALGKTYLHTRDFRAAYAAFTRLIEETVSEDLEAAARLERSEIALHFGNWIDAKRDAFAVLVSAPEHLRPRSLFLFAEACARLGQTKWALDHDYELWLSFPTDPLASAAWKAIEQLGRPLPEVPLQKRLLRPRRLMAAGRVEAAIRDLETLLERMEALSVAEKGDLLRLLAEAQIRLGRFKAAERALGSLLEGGDSPHRAEAARSLAHLYLAQNRRRALERLHRRVSQWKTSPEVVTETAFSRAFLAERNGRRQEAERGYAALASVKNPRQADALWRLSWMAIRAGKLREADRRLERFLLVAGEELPKGLYWQGRVAWHLGNRKRAIASWQEAVRRHPHHFYGIEAARALERAKAPLPNDPDAPPFPPFPDWNATTGNFAEQRARELFRLHFYEPAARALQERLEDDAGNRTLVLALAEALHRGGKHGEAARVLEGRFAETLRRGGVEVPRRFWEIAYPLDFVAQLEDASRRYHLDLFLVAALIRQTSFFEPEGAQGWRPLLPLPPLPKGSQSLPQAEGKPLPPAVTLDLGCAWLRKRLDHFHGHLPFVLAAYRADEARVKRWWKRSRSGILRDDPNYAIETIDDPATNAFVKNVLTDLARYRKIYREGPRSSEEFEGGSTSSHDAREGG